MKKRILTLISLLFCISLAFAGNNESSETGFLVGKVYVNNENTVANDAKIILKGTDIATVTNANGTFRLSNIPVGSYEIHIVLENKEAVSVGTVEVHKNKPYNVQCFVMY